MLKMRNADGASIFFLSYRVHVKIMEAVWPLTVLCVIPRTDSGLAGANLPKRHRSRVMMACLLAAVWLSGPARILL